MDSYDVVELVMAVCAIVFITASAVTDLCLSFLQTIVVFVLP